MSHIFPVSRRGSQGLHPFFADADRITLSLASRGNVELASIDDLVGTIVGSSRALLVREPRNIQTHILGSGQIIDSDLP
jgi:hypothetical protein